jgi:SAM-dependent methyltransferase
MSDKSTEADIDAISLAEEVKQAAQESITEEDLRIRIETILRKILEPFGISWARYERSTKFSSKRSDALYGTVIIEYEKPEAFNIASGFNHAIEQLKIYITNESTQSSVASQRYFGVALDGFKIGFIRYNLRLKDWEIEGPTITNESSILKLLEAIRGLARKPLDADLLIKDVGPGSKVAKEAVKSLYRHIIEAKTNRSTMLFNDWRRVFSQVCAYSPDKIRGLEEIYGIKEKEIDYEALLFAVHTYYALVMKLLAAEVAVLFGGFHLTSYNKELEQAYMKNLEFLKKELDKLEQGGVFINLGIENFLEADYFGWYIDEWDQELAESIVGIIKKLSEYEAGTAELEPDSIRDLFKKLYQNLVPKKIRHDLGEYYTPDWLSELVLDEIGYTEANFDLIAGTNGVRAPLDLRLLDPACGSGTFVVLAIKRIKEYARKKRLDKDVLTKIVKNVVGFDLNPLAVMATRANYLLALGELIRASKITIELPVYFADSVLAERRSTLAGIEYSLSTIVGTFFVPVAIVEKGTLGTVLSLIEECIHNNYSPIEFNARALKELNNLKEGELEEVSKLYFQILELEKSGKNKIWTRVLKNSFAPLFVGRFNFVVGNPPWINWESLPSDYRKATYPLWQTYGLQARSTSKQFELGKMRRDISMLFVYCCSDRYLEKEGKLGFLITQMVFKTKGADVFRRFLLPDGNIPLKVLKVHDMVSLKPFEGATNMTSIIFLQKGKQTTYPVRYVLWKKEKKCDTTNISLAEAYALCSQEKLSAIPIDPQDRKSTWLTGKSAIITLLNKVTGKSVYKAYAGVYTGGANGIYWIKILNEVSDELVTIENLYDCGKRKVSKEIATIEKGLIHSLIRSGNISKWFIKPECYMILPHTKNTDWQALSESKMKIDYPKTYNYLSKFKHDLLERKAYTLLRQGHPFYIVVDIHKASFAPFKVAWKRMGSNIEAAVLGSYNAPFIGKKPIIPQETISFVPFQKEEEAHYLCAMLNSLEVNSLVQSFSQLGGKSFATPSILDQVKIPRFDSTNELHNALVSLSKKAHILRRQGKQSDLLVTESEINRHVARLYMMSKKELNELESL